MEHLNEWQQILKEIVSRMGMPEVRAEADPEGRRISLYVNDEYVPLNKSIMQFVGSLNYMVQLIAKKNGWEPVFVDVNNYRRERERLILELARAAAKKAQVTKQDVSLPAMNAYERRLVHTELAMRPDVKTESIGEGKERYVVIRPL